MKGKLITQRIRTWKIPIGMRTVKTALSVSLALSIIEHYGASPAKVVFATIGAISAVAPTFTASLEACLTQICGVFVGTMLAVCMLALNIPNMIAVGIGVILILSAYQYFRLKLVPVLPCLVLVNICLNTEIQVVPYSIGRLWDTAIGLGVGMLINTLIFPYDNSRTIRRTMAELDSDLIGFLEDMFDGDDHFPETKMIGKKVDTLERQMVLFSEQRLLHRKRQKRELQRLKTCEDTTQELLVELMALSNLDCPGTLNQQNRQVLRSLGAKISPEVPKRPERKEDVVTNYHVSQVLRLRKELKEQLAERSRRDRKKQK